MAKYMYRSWMELILIAFHDCKRENRLNNQLTISIRYCSDCAAIGGEKLITSIKVVSSVEWYRHRCIVSAKANSRIICVFCESVRIQQQNNGIPNAIFDCFRLLDQFLASVHCTYGLANGHVSISTQAHTVERETNQRCGRQATKT